MGSAGSAGREHQSRRLILSLCHPAGAASSPSFLARIPRAAAGLLSAGLLVAFSALFATEAGAQTTTLISNVAQDDGTLNLPSPAAARVGPSGNNTFTQAQQFTTGDNEGGYTLTEVVAYIRNFEGSDAARVSVYTADSDGDPGSSEHVLTGMITDKSLNTFTALPNATLAKETEYFVVFEATAGFYSLGTTTTDKLDANPANEWSINNERHYKLSDTGDWTTSSKEARIQIKGTAGGTAATVPDAPQEFTATAGFSSATLAWQPPSNEGGSPILGYQYQYKQGDGTYYDWTDIRNSESLTSHVLSRGAAPNTTVTYKLRAKNLIGGGATAEQSVTFAGALTVRWAETALSFAEAAGDVQFEVVAETATGGVKPDSNFQVVLSKLSLTATPGTLAEGGDYQGIPDLVTFVPEDFTHDGQRWVASKAVTVTIHDDNYIEEDEQFAVILESGLTLCLAGHFCYINV